MNRSSTSRSPPSFRHLAHFHARPSGVLTPSTHHERRRKEALELQKQRRMHAFEQARQSHFCKDPLDLDSVEQLSLGARTREGRDEDASEDEVDEEGDIYIVTDGPGGMETTESKSPSSALKPKLQKTRRHRSTKPIYKPWARNLLTHAETLDLGHALPEAFWTGEWSLKLCPDGKRCLCVTGHTANGSNTILYSRVSGRTLSRVYVPALPPDCLLDTIHDPSTNALWVLDLIKWNGVYYVDLEHGFRKWFLQSRLSELQRTTHNDPQWTQLLPVPTLDAPLTPRSLAFFLQTAFSTTTSSSTMDAMARPTWDGLLFYLDVARYESGSTPLVGWVPAALEIKSKPKGEGEGEGEGESMTVESEEVTGLQALMKLMENVEGIEEGMAVE
ncbi:BQ2448_2596 [Microbotryum intermedium]|uniref:Snurportin-1 n=1 Tax=Microbotryum intermedium TaxID=269621 RepID=A0A238FES0_9BASI|nr:BQ2448_2596 [Microbotryum intermedium]